MTDLKNKVALVTGASSGIGAATVKALLKEGMKARPAIWDMEHADYADKNKKKNSWDEIAVLLVKEDATAEEKKRMGKIITKKWKHMRDRYAREVRERKGKIGQAATKKASYTYSQKMSFLKDIILSRPTISTMDIVEIADVQRDPADVATAAPSSSGVKRKKPTGKLNPVETKLPEVLDENAIRREQKEKEEADDDRLFLLSLLPTLKQVPLHNKLNVRVAIMQCVSNFAVGILPVTMPTYSHHNPYRQYENHTCNRCTTIRDNATLPILNHSCSNCNTKDSSSSDDK